MDNLNESDRERVSQTFEKGVGTFTEEDLEKVKADAETAEKKAKSLGGQFESFQLIWSLLQDYWAGKYTTIPWMHKRSEASIRVSRVNSRLL